MNSGSQNRLKQTLDVSSLVWDDKTVNVTMWSCVELTECELAFGNKWYVFPNGYTSVLNEILYCVYTEISWGLRYFKFLFFATHFFSRWFGINRNTILQCLGHHGAFQQHICSWRGRLQVGLQLKCFCRGILPGEGRVGRCWKWLLRCRFR